MRIGIDVTASIYHGTGVGSYYRLLVPELMKQGKNHEFVLLGYALRRFSRLDLANKKFPFPPRFMEFIWNHLHVLPVEMLAGKVDVFHAWDYLQPPASKARIVTTIHDLSAIKFPMYHHLSTVTAQEHRLRWVRREADLIIADSETTKKDIVELLGIEPERVRVVYLAAGAAFGEFKEQRAKSKEQEVTRVREKYNIGENYLLAVGTMEPRKNLKRIVEAFLGVRSKESGVRNLIVVGRAGWGEQLKPTEGVNFLGLVSDTDLPALYAGAQALIYPSLYEGFGLPILEAMTVGCPVVTSDLGSLKEISGKAAILVDPENVESIVIGIQTALDKRQSLINRGYQRAGDFSWEKTAKQTLDIYESLG